MSEKQQFKFEDQIPLTVRRDQGKGTYKVALAGIDLEQHLLADGVRIEFVDRGDGIHEPQVTLVFAPGATELDLDTELIGYLRAKDAEQQKPVIENHDCFDVCDGKP